MILYKETYNLDAVRCLFQYIYSIKLIYELYEKYFMSKGDVLRTENENVKK